MTLKRYKPLGIFILIYIVLIVIVNILMNRSLQDRNSPQTKANRKSVAAGRLPSEASKKSKNFLRPDNPIRYNIVEQKRYVPHNQQQWDEYMKKALQETQALKQIKTAGASSNLKKSKADIQRQRQNIARLITVYETILRASPGDTESQQRLQELYMLRATLDTLQNKIVTDKK